MEENKKKPGIPAILIIIGIILIAGILIFAVSSTKNQKNGDDTQKTSAEDGNSSNKSDASDNEQDAEDSEGDEESEDSTEQKQELISGETAKELVQMNNDSYDAGEIKCSNFSRYSGQYVEDGRDELVENVAAFLVTNNSSKYLEFATLEYEIDGQEAIFVVTGLPAGKSAWVMEKSRLVIASDATFTYKGCADSFRDDVVSSTDKIGVSASGNMMTAKNNTSKTLNNVCVYYKVNHTDGKYLGGITYVVNFGELKSGKSLEKLAGHFDIENTEIVRISWQDS